MNIAVLAQDKLKNKINIGFGEHQISKENKFSNLFFLTIYFSCRDIALVMTILKKNKKRYML